MSSRAAVQVSGLSFQRNGGIRELLEAAQSIRPYSNATHGHITDDGAHDIAAQASAAWEAAVCWQDEYAVKRLAEVRAV